MSSTTNTFTATPVRTQPPRARSASALRPPQRTRATVRLPMLFSTSFGPAALLYPALSLAPRMNYGKAHTHCTTAGVSEGAARKGRDDDMHIARPTISCRWTSCSMRTATSCSAKTATTSTRTQTTGRGDTGAGAEGGPQEEWAGASHGFDVPNFHAHNYGAGISSMSANNNNANFNAPPPTLNPFVAFNSHFHNSNAGNNNNNGRSGGGGNKHDNDAAMPTAAPPSLPRTSPPTHTSPYAHTYCVLKAPNRDNIPIREKRTHFFPYWDYSCIVLDIQIHLSAALLLQHVLTSTYPSGAYPPSA
ncbi:hypothetical protein B0H10DRAFT_2214117 [Mycena sp. CBHHK59/15]|nr:hypothetical protein B0H10DRAFT_2214117 [Mycena sp. CBHHK59/15]